MPHLLPIQISLPNIFTPFSPNLNVHVKKYLACLSIHDQVIVGLFTFGIKYLHRYLYMTTIKSQFFDNIRSNCCSIFYYK